jgi:3-hydroxybutyryl-CoA dehydrogenase
MDIKKVGVLGCGLMGSGIAQVAATAGFDVTVLEVEQKYLDKGFAGIEKSLAKFAEKGALRNAPGCPGRAQGHDQHAGPGRLRHHRRGRDRKRR